MKENADYYFKVFGEEDVDEEGEVEKVVNEEKIEQK